MESQPQRRRALLGVNKEYTDALERTLAQTERSLAEANATCAGVQGSQEVRERTFALAILEEAGKASAPEALMIALRAQKTFLVGDSRQLPPHIWDPMRDVLRNPSKLQTQTPAREDEAEELRAAIEDLGNTPQEREHADQETLFDHFADRLKDTEHEAALSTQYRMLPEIGEIVSDVFYKDIGGLKHGRRQPIDPRVQAFAGATRVKLIDIPGREEYDGKSKHRSAEVDHIQTELAALQEAAAHIGPPWTAPTASASRSSRPTPRRHAGYARTSTSPATPR